MKSIKCGLLILGLFCMLGSGAQNPVNLRLDVSSLNNIGGTIRKDTTYSLTVTIYNDSAADFRGKFSIGGVVDSFFSNGDTAGALFYDSLAQDSVIIPGGGSGSVTRSITLNPNYVPSIIGSSGVVIWPIVSYDTFNHYIFISDSVAKTVIVSYPAGIDELNARNLKVYMNGQQLMIQDNGEYPLQNVRLYDVAGNLLQQQQLSMSGIVNMGQYATGVYFAEITFEDNTRVVVKIANTR